MKQTTFPANWRMTTLGEIAREKPNNGIFRKNPEYLTNGSKGLPVVWVEDLFRGSSIDTKNSRRIDATKTEIEKYGLKKGDILFCRSSLKLDGIAFNNIYLGTDNGALFECHIIRISPRLQDVSPVFLNWALRSPQLRAIAKSKSKTATMTTIDQESLGSIAIPLPPLAEQRRIAEVLNRTEELRAKRRAALHQLDALTESIFSHLFGDVAKNDRNWPNERMEDVIRIRRGGSPRPIEKYLGGDINWIKIGDGTQGSDIYLERCADKITREGLKKTVFLKAGSLIFANCGVSLGFARILKIDGCIHDGWLSFEEIPETRLNKLFLLKALNSITEYFRRIAPAGTQPNLNTSLMKNFRIILPPISMQREFARRVMAVEKLKIAQRASLAKMDELFASLQHRAFRGEL